jgi:hypothetical protein
VKVNVQSPYNLWLLYRRKLADYPSPATILGRLAMNEKALKNELTDVELLEFIRDISRELTAMTHERGMHTLVPALKNTEATSRNALSKIRKR